MVPSPVILNVWESLNYPCQQSCGKLFKTNELDAHYRIQCSESHNTIILSSKPTQSNGSNFLGVNIASENKQRCLAKKQLEATNVVAEAAPFSFPLKRGEEMRPAALAYVNKLTSLVYHLLDENDRYYINNIIVLKLIIQIYI